MNCLAFALRVWSRDNDYKIWYNSTHCINLPSGSSAVGFLPAEKFGYDYFINAFKDVLKEEDKKMLKKYFDK
jgi:hypothetical protein